MKLDRDKTGTWRVTEPDVPPALALLAERLRTALLAMNSAPPKDGGGTYEQRRDHAAAQHLEFEIAPLVEALDINALVAQIAEAAIAAHVTTTREVRRILPISTETRIPPGQRVQITTRPQSTAMRVDRITISQHSADFLIHDIRVGNRSQFEQSGSISGDMLNDPDTILALEAIRTAMDFILEVEYVGDNPYGEQFIAMALGRDIEL